MNIAHSKTSSFNLPDTSNPTPVEMPVMPFGPDAVKMIKQAYDDGEVKFFRRSKYRGKPAKPGCIFYLINYIVMTKTDADGKQMEAPVYRYKGAYELKQVAETELISEGQLTNFLIRQLAKAMTL